MKNPARLEAYLANLEKFLYVLPISEKAEIITEIKSHVLESLESGDQPVEEILKSLGDPKEVANKYLADRGIPAYVPPKSPSQITKWVTLGILGSIISFFVFILVITWTFTPIIQVNEESGRVKILGGLIDINDANGTVKIGSIDNGSFTITSDDEKLEIKAKEDLKKLEVNNLNIKFTNGKFSVKNSQDNFFHYECKFDDKGQKISKSVSDKTLFFNLDEFSGSKCEFEIPEQISFAIRGDNGKIMISKLRNNIDVKMQNGKIGMKPDPRAEYKYETSVLRGRISNFQNSSSDKAYLVKLDLVNGKINRF